MTIIQLYSTLFSAVNLEISDVYLYATICFSIDCLSKKIQSFILNYRMFKNQFLSWLQGLTLTCILFNNCQYDAIL